MKSGSGWRPVALRNYYVYIMASKSGTLYVGVTNDLLRRVYQHKQKIVPGFTAKYKITSLLYFEETDSASGAISREKQLKGWLRGKKVALIKSLNPNFEDLSADWFDSEE